MLTFKHLLTALTIASVAVASPLVQQNNPTISIDRVGEIVTEISSVVTGAVGSLCKCAKVPNLPEQHR